ncbi:hypothetical protein NQZ68_020286, partial [Dissostichus eleginoides]
LQGQKARVTDTQSGRSLSPSTGCEWLLVLDTMQDPGWLLALGPSTSPLSITGADLQHEDMSQEECNSTSQSVIMAADQALMEVKWE